jgi:hypothetical protein
MLPIFKTYVRMFTWQYKMFFVLYIVGTTVLLASLHSHGFGWLASLSITCACGAVSSVGAMLIIPMYIVAKK